MSPHVVDLIFGYRPAALARSGLVIAGNGSQPVRQWNASTFPLQFGFQRLDNRLVVEILRLAAS